MPTYNHSKSLPTAQLPRFEIPSRHPVQREQPEDMKKIQRWLPRSHNGNPHMLVKRDNHHREATLEQSDDTPTQVKVREQRRPRTQLLWEEELMDQV
jgi:hypothetical protein